MSLAGQGLLKYKNVIDLIKVHEKLIKISSFSE